MEILSHGTTCREFQNFGMWLWAAILLFFLPPSGAISQDVTVTESMADVIERTERSVVRIEVHGSDGESLGSGFVVADGIIATNCHVLAGARRARVYFPDGRAGEVEGTLVIDEARDIVLARITMRGVPEVQFASAVPRKGEAVIALGSPHGLSFTATTGIVSAIRTAEEMAKDIGDDSLKGTWIQVDAALSPGNSGGPIIDRSGAVVAMSTLASQGSAQNLNFGISASDISSALGRATGAPLLTLASGVGRLSSGAGRSPGPGPSTNLANVPRAAVEAYVESGRKNFTALIRGLRQESARLSSELREMRKGQAFIPPAVPSDAAVARVSLPGQRERKWFFRSQSVKDAAIEQQQERIRESNHLRNTIDDRDDPESILTLLSHHGPALNPRANKSVGFATDVIVLHAFNEHDVLALYDDSPYMLWMDSTAGLSTGEMLSVPVFVAGTTTAQMESGLTASVTVLQEVTARQLREVIEGGDAEVEDPSQTAGSPKSPQERPRDVRAMFGITDVYRVWTDRSGRFAVEALLLEFDGEKAILKKRDESIISVPVSALCEGDVRYLKQ